MKNNRTLEQDFMLVVLGFITQESDPRNSDSRRHARMLADRILAETQLPRTHTKEEV